MHFCWDSIDGGWEREALEDLTGGLGYTLDLYKKDKQEWGNTIDKYLKPPPFAYIIVVSGGGVMIIMSLLFNK